MQRIANFLIAMFMGIAFLADAQTAPCFPLDAALQADSSKKSVKWRAAAAWGKDSVAITWHAPAVRGRTIWGGLVPYGEVWVTGAHMATNMELPFAVTVGDVKLKKGKYALFTIPGKEQWTLVINRNWEQHLTDEYDAKDDVVRIRVTPQTSCGHAERLQWGFAPAGDKEAQLYVRWEQVQVSVPVQR
jgi:predicted Rdx family selenoprotein